MLVFSYSNMIKKSTDHVSVYGALHSPWLQAVLLGLHEKGISHSLQPIPSLRLLINSGVMMPAAKINHGPWQLDSEEILKSLGFEGINEDDKRSIDRTWNGVLHRVDSPLEFIKELPSVGADERLPHLRDQILLPRTISIKRIRREREPVIDVH